MFDESRSPPVAVAAPVADRALTERRERALGFLFGRIDYERQHVLPARFRGLKLGRMRDFLARLGDPQQGLAIVHVAGTKGKGSTAAMIAGILTASGRRTGLFTSPHVRDVEERFAIDGCRASTGQFVALMDRVQPVVEAMDGELGEGRGPTYFEITTALALLHFAEENVDAAVLEVGMGGRLDATNVCQPAVSVITSISFDHTRQLGNTLAAIAGEKAGIIKPGVPVVSGVRASEAAAAIRGRAERQSAPLIELGRDFDVSGYAPASDESANALPHVDVSYRLAERSGELRSIELAMPGRHQADNAAVAILAVQQLRAQGWIIDDEALRSGLRAAQVPCRIEVVRRRPTVIIDVAHNLASIDALLATLDESFPSSRRTLIFATTRDKDAAGMIARLLPHFQRITFTRYLNNPRSVPPDELAAIAANLSGRQWPTFDRPQDAWQTVIETAANEDQIVVTGSFFIAAEVRELLAE